MSSDISYSMERGQKDEECSRSDIPTSTATGELGGSEATGTKERPVVRRVKLAFARHLPKTYRMTSKVLLYLKGPRPKRDLDRAFYFVTPLAHRSNGRPFVNWGPGICRTDSLPLIHLQLQSSNVVTPFRIGMDSVHTTLHPSSPPRPLRRRLHHRPRILHPSTVVSNTPRDIVRMYRHLLASK
jgi:hypothetical protein